MVNYLIIESQEILSKIKTNPYTIDDFVENEQLSIDIEFFE